MRRTLAKECVLRASVSFFVQINQYQVNNLSPDVSKTKELILKQSRVGHLPIHTGEAEVDRVSSFQLMCRSPAHHT